MALCEQLTPSAMLSPRMKLEGEMAEELARSAKDWALSNGLVLRDRRSKDRSDRGETVPFSLLPAPFPRTLFNKACQVQEDMSLLYFRCSADFHFITTALESVVKTDDFTSRLLDIYKRIHEEGITQGKVLQIQRPDYMLHMPENSVSGHWELKQLEVNNIASGFAPVSCRCSLWHRVALQELGISEEEISAGLPPNKAQETVVDGLVAGWDAYGNADAVMLTIVEDLSQNTPDQKLSELGFREKSRAGSLRLTLTECADRLTLDERSKTLTVTGGLCSGREVGLVYFRSGYSPQQYGGEKEWAARLMIERSKAVKCPWIGCQLSGTKKVQQVLARPGMLERYLADRPKEAVDSVRETFAGLWGLDKDGLPTEDLFKKVAENPNNFVLKPQREGGGNNIHGREIVEFLARLSKDEREAYILMERLRPPLNHGYLLRPNEPLAASETVSEFGIFGSLVGDVKDGKAEMIRRIYKAALCENQKESSGQLDGIGRTPRSNKKVRGSGRGCLSRHLICRFPISVLTSYRMAAHSLITFHC